MLPYRTGLWLKSSANRCVLCRMRPIEVGYLCQDCDQDLMWLPPAFELSCGAKSLTVQPASTYHTVMAQAILSFKEQEQLTTLPFLVHALAKLGERLDLPAKTLIVPMPTTQKRLVQRGFYPVGILARYLSALTGYACYQGVVRFGEQVQQRKLDRSERLHNLLHAFSVVKPPTSRSLLLFDDVATTGATLTSLADCLWAYDPNLHLTAVCLAHGHG